jgi:asparagine synthase (glutamine-hydrolysing)
MNKLSQLWQLWRCFGPDWFLYRLGYEARLRGGYFRRQMPVAEWDTFPLNDLLDRAYPADPVAYAEYRRAEPPCFFFAPADVERYQPLFARWDDGADVSPQTIAEGILRGELRYFERPTGQVGFPPDWRRNPFTGERAPEDLHWSQIGTFDHGDIKIIWEPSRFGFVYALVRAYWRTGDEQYPTLFWQLVEDWRMRNHPQRGPNWKCGQEISFRVMAWCFGLYGFLHSQTTTPQRVTMLAQMVAVSGRRIEADLEHSISQRNNHGISAGLGLWTIGLLFPELRQSSQWREKGREVLERLGRELIYDDGAFVQHSVNYHRLMLHDYLWALRLGDLHDRPLSAELRERVKQAADWLYQIQDDVTGRVPYYGQNDGALVLPLNNCDYQDFRPVVQTIHHLYAGSRRYPDGPWDEDLLWLFGPAALESPVEAANRADLGAQVGGYYTLRSPTGFVFTRCAAFRHRPSQTDMLHLDLWWRGQNVALDAGTYSYNAPLPWDNPLARTAHHNAVEVDCLDQMERAGRFLWFPWLNSRVLYHQLSGQGHLVYWEGEHDGYRRLKDPVTHRRGILRLGDDAWMIVDGLRGRESHHYRLHWLLPDVSYEWDGERLLTLHLPISDYYVEVAAMSGEVDCSLVRADRESPRGWRAPYYHYREPALSLALTADVDSVFFWTLFSPTLCQVATDGATLCVQAEGRQAQISWQMQPQQPLITSVSITGDCQDTLKVS